jgi:hypothetical protein
MKRPALESECYNLGLFNAPFPKKNVMRRALRALREDVMNNVGAISSSSEYIPDGDDEDLGWGSKSKPSKKAKVVLPSLKKTPSDDSRTVSATSNLAGLSRLLAAKPLASGSFKSSTLIAPIASLAVQAQVGKKSQKGIFSKPLVSKCGLYHIPHPSH